jgi:hypothetical protein
MLSLIPSEAGLILGNGIKNNVDIYYIDENYIRRLPYEIF